MGVIIDTQLHTLDKILNKAARNAPGLTPSFPPMEAIHCPTKERGLGYAPFKDKATQMGIEHLMKIFNKPTEWGCLAFSHTSRVATLYQHWPKEADEANKTKLPTLRVLSYIQQIAWAEIEHIPILQAPNHIATSLRAATKEVDENKARRRETSQQTYPQKPTLDNSGTNANRSNTRTCY